MPISRDARVDEELERAISSGVLELVAMRDALVRRGNALGIVVHNANVSAPTLANLEYGTDPDANELRAPGSSGC